MCQICVFLLPADKKWFQRYTRLDTNDSIARRFPRRSHGSWMGWPFTPGGTTHNTKRTMGCWFWDILGQVVVAKIERCWRNTTMNSLLLMLLREMMFFFIIDLQLLIDVFFQSIVNHTDFILGHCIRMPKVGHALFIYLCEPKLVFHSHSNCCAFH